MSLNKSRITRWLERSPTPVLTLYAAVVSFSVYFCMYAFRKPFSAATYEGLQFFGSEVDLKTAFVISQIFGYALSKFVGIKVCSETSRGNRLWTLAGLILAAEAALLLFGILPVEFKLVALFCNGLPLGMVWGLVVLYLEGRQTSELLLAGLSCSFIVSSAMVKSVGWTLIITYGIDDFRMPSLTGAIFLVPFAIAIYLLNQIPEPTEADIEARVEREPMNGTERREFLRRFLPGMILLLVPYFFLTAYRDFRDNFMVDIFQELGFGDNPEILTTTEVPVAFGVLVALGALFMIKNNRLGLVATYGIMIFGLALMGGSTLLLDEGKMQGDAWMICVGLGAYLAYVPFGSVLFDRLIAATRVTGTAVFAIYVADALGYTGSIGVLLYKALFEPAATHLDFFRRFTYGMSLLGVVLLTCSCVYFIHVSKKVNRE